MGILKRAVLSLSSGRLSHLAADRRGVAALEFALIAPLLLSMYFLTMEVGQGIETNKKVGRAASMVADLVTQQQSTTKAELNAILDIGSALLQPYSRSKPTIVITAIEVTDETTPKVKVVWSRKMVNGAYSADQAAGTITTIPNALKIKGSFLVRVQSSLDYYPVITWAAGDKGMLGLTAAFDKLEMSETYYLRPRMTQSIACSDC
ncbi:MAG TPA: pilus assembly protein [Rhizobiales bacterium]|nr:pilus assembly protein [Hyphomicrobiales bacterium]